MPVPYCTVSLFAARRERALVGEAPGPAAVALHEEAALGKDQGVAGEGSVVEGQLDLSTEKRQLVEPQVEGVLAKLEGARRRHVAGRRQLVDRAAQPRDGEPRLLAEPHALEPAAEAREVAVEEVASCAGRGGRRSAGRPRRSRPPASQTPSASTYASRSATVVSNVFVFDVGVTYDTVILVSKNVSRVVLGPDAVGERGFEVGLRLVAEAVLGQRCSGP